MLTEGEVIQLTQDVSEATGLLIGGVALFAGGNTPQARVRGAQMILASRQKIDAWFVKLQAEAAD